MPTMPTTDSGSRPKDIEDFVKESKNLTTADETGMPDDYQVANTPEHTLDLGRSGDSRQLEVVVNKTTPTVVPRTKRSTDEQAQGIVDQKTTGGPPEVKRARRHGLPSKLCEPLIYYLVAAVCLFTLVFGAVVIVDHTEIIEL